MLELLLKDKLRELRSDMDLTQKQVGKYLNMTRQGYAHYEEGTRNPSNQILFRISKLYKVDISELINKDTTPIDVAILRENDAYNSKKDEQNPNIMQTTRDKHKSSDNKKLIKMYNKLSTLEKENVLLFIENILKENQEKKT